MWCPGAWFPWYPGAWFQWYPGAWFQWYPGALFLLVSLDMLFTHKSVELQWIHDCLQMVVVILASACQVAVRFIVIAEELNMGVGCSVAAFLSQACWII